MCRDGPEEPSVVKARAGLFWLQKTETVQDENVDGAYGLVINGHSLVKTFFMLFPVVSIYVLKLENVSYFL